MLAEVTGMVLLMETGAVHVGAVDSIPAAEMDQVMHRLQIVGTNATSGMITVMSTAERITDVLILVTET